jgi:hypothetical protein
MMQKCQVRFGGEPMEKWLSRQLASGLPYFISTVSVPTLNVT